MVPSGVHAAACWCVEPVGVRGAACWCRLVHFSQEVLLSDSWLLARGSWLSARGSWLSALGSRHVVWRISRWSVCLLDPWGPPNVCPSALRCQRLTLSRRKGIYHLLALASLERRQRCGKAEAVCGVVQVGAWPPCLASQCATSGSSKMWRALSVCSWQ
jgi:hypothetical protein